MEETTIDLLQIKIEKAKSQLTDETLNAINAVDWKDAILKMRTSKGYSFEQLGVLETETELVLCGLLNPRDYSKELENRMGISKQETNELVNKMNEQVFSKIKEELIKSSERKSTPLPTQIPSAIEKPAEQKNDNNILSNAGIEILPEENNLPVPEKLEINTAPKTITQTPSISAQKLSAPVQTPAVQTNHTLENITKTVPTTYPKNGDPYRLPPE